KREIGRLREILTLVELDGCQVTHLCAHFGETLDGACGHCSWCLNGHTAQTLSRRAPAAIDDATAEQIRTLRQEHADILDEPRVIARLLCGVLSPALTQAKLHQQPLFGRCENVPFRSIMQWAEALDA